MTVQQSTWQCDREPRIAILVLGCVLPVYERCIRIIRATWGGKFVDNVDIYYVYGAQTTHTSQATVPLDDIIGRSVPPLPNGAVWVSGDNILCGAADLQEGQRDCILRKRLIAFGYLAKEQRYDFVYTVCATSYVVIPALQQYLRRVPALGVYQGPLGVDGASGYPFVSGASMLLSGDIAAHLGEHLDAIVASYPESMPDDVVIGHWIAIHYAHESLADICERVRADRMATRNQTFVMPYGMGIADFVMTPAYSQVVRESTYHYHFHSRRMWEMEHFHRRFFAN